MASADAFADLGQEYAVVEFADNRGHRDGTRRFDAKMNAHPKYFSSVSRLLQHRANPGLPWKC